MLHSLCSFSPKMNSIANHNAKFIDNNDYNK